MCNRYLFITFQNQELPIFFNISSYEKYFKINNCKSRRLWLGSRSLNRDSAESKHNRLVGKKCANCNVGISENQLIGERNTSVLAPVSLLLFKINPFVVDGIISADISRWTLSANNGIMTLLLRRYFAISIYLCCVFMQNYGKLFHIS